MHFLGFTLFNFIFLSSIWKVYAIPDHSRKSNIKMTYRARRHLQPRQVIEHQPTCNEDNLMLFLAQLKAINPESIINLSTEDETTHLCGTLSDNLDAIDEFLGTCKVTTQGLYIQLIKGVDALYDYLCNSTGGKHWQHYFLCYKALHNDFSSCVGPGDWVEFPESNKICDAYRDIVDCYYVKTAKVCGLSAAKAMKAMNMAVINRVIGIRCCNINRNPKVHDAYKMACGKQQVVVITPLNLLFIVLIQYVIVICMYNIRIII